MNYWKIVLGNNYDIEYYNGNELTIGVNLKNMINASSTEYYIFNKNNINFFTFKEKTKFLFYERYYIVKSDLNIKLDISNLNKNQFTINDSIIHLKVPIIALKKIVSFIVNNKEVAYIHRKSSMFSNSYEFVILHDYQHIDIVAIIGSIYINGASSLS